MEIRFKYNRFASMLIVEQDNIKIQQDITDVTDVNQDGVEDKAKNNDCKEVETDISDDAMEMLTTLLYDIYYCRIKEFDSSYLIKELFKKLPIDKKELLMKELKQKNND